MQIHPATIMLQEAGIGYLPANSLAQDFATFAKVRVLSEDQKKQLQALGFKIEIVGGN